ncbi:hypothetical protein DFP73DRAFT_542927 [Morchella snyderi]|nr:hypothetical protein DFP73DRAFT_542927 [Morchella snyderi]
MCPSQVILSFLMTGCTKALGPPACSALIPGSVLAVGGTFLFFFITKTVGISGAFLLTTGAWTGLGTYRSIIICRGFGAAAGAPGGVYFGSWSSSYLSRPYFASGSMRFSGRVLCGRGLRILPLVVVVSAAFTSCFGGAAAGWGL